METTWLSQPSISGEVEEIMTVQPFGEIQSQALYHLKVDGVP